MPALSRSCVLTRAGSWSLCIQCFRSKNRIKKVPSYIGLMIYCNRLGLSHNRIQRLPRSIGKMESLRVLLLDYNRLEELPDELFMLPKLERLSLAKNKLTKLPRAVGNLKNLKYIDVSGNRKLKSITSGIAGCKSLEELRCSDCSIQKLPVDCAKLEHLRLIVAENNRVESVASALFLYAEGLQTIALYGNPIDMSVVENTKGYKEWEARRATRWPEAAKKGPGVLLGKKAEEEARGASVLWSNQSGGDRDHEKKTMMSSPKDVATPNSVGTGQGVASMSGVSSVGAVGGTGGVTSTGVSRGVRSKKGTQNMSPQVSSGGRLKTE